jgi:hypothetical protein
MLFVYLGGPSEMQKLSFFVVLAVSLGLACLSVLAQSEPASRLDFSTYLGGGDAERVTAVRVDRSGNWYLAGATRSADFPARASLLPPPSPPASFEMGFLTKLRPDGSIVYSTFWPRAVVALAVDPIGNAFVVDNLPMGTRFSGPLGDVVVTKIDPGGSEVSYSVRLAGSKLEQGAAIAVDDTGAVVVVGQTSSPDFPLVSAVQQTVQTRLGESSDKSAFVTKLDPRGGIVFSTGWGGSREDAATAVAIDQALNIYVAGTTGSPDFVTSQGSFQPRLASETCTANSLPCGDGFVTKLSGDGQAIVYSTLFGGSNGETVQAVAVDARGSVHLAGTTASADLPLRRALRSSCDDTRQIYGCSGYVAKLNPTGASLEYATYFGSGAYYVFGLGQTIRDIVVDASGHLLVVGTTQGNDLPLIGALQSVNGGGPLFKSIDDGASWTASSSGLTGTGIWSLAGAGRRPADLYAATFGQIFHSRDQGRTWRAQREATAGVALGHQFLVDPLTPSILYSVDTRDGVLKSTDAGATWSKLPLDVGQIIAIAMAPSAPSHIYAGGLSGVFHSATDGLTWSRVLDLTASQSTRRVQTLGVDPQDAEVVYAALSDGTILRRDRGAQWTEAASVRCPIDQFVFAAGIPSTIYARACGNFWKSVDKANSWTELDVAGRSIIDIALDPAVPNAIYAAAGSQGVHRSTDRGASWWKLGDWSDHDVRSILLDPEEPRTIYVGTTGASNAFVAAFDASGTLTFSTYVGGRSSAGAGITVERSGTIVVAGTAGREFPLVCAIQSRYAGATDAFLARISVRP